ncbi:MAG: hypothetical protein HOV94_28965 [Saccharothrix sp.]|nr:hypothetical protein [Saccharothrix sp.]
MGAEGVARVLVAAGIVAAAAAATLLAVVVNIATGGDAGLFPWAAEHPLRWVVGATVAVASSSGWVVWAQRRVDRRLMALIPAPQRPESWVVDRPAEVAAVVAALRGRGGTVGVTTALRGAGGFGKTTVAKLVRADRRVLRHFRNRVYWVTLGRDVRSRGALARKVNDLVGRLDPGRPVTFTDPEQAGAHLAALLAGMPRTLLILDDVWYLAQEAAFPVAGRGTARLITTRIPSLVEKAIPVRVDEVTDEQAVAILTAGLPPLSRDVTARLLAATGRWPLLLRLANKVLVDQHGAGADIKAVAAELLDQLARGPARVDRLTGVPVASLDVNEPGERDQAVATTIEASAGLLTAAERERLTELSLFAEDETIPVPLVALLWRATGSLDAMAARALCARLHDLALVTLDATADGGTLVLHDAIRDHLHDQVPDHRRPQLHAALLDAVGIPDGAWWTLDESHRYLWDHLVEHLLAAGRLDAAEALASDLRWVAARLEQAGPTAPYADLSLVDTPLCHRLHRLLGQNAHLLAPTDPAHNRVDILHSRAAVEPAWSRQAAHLARRRAVPRLVNRTVPPDPPYAALRHVLPEKGPVAGLVIAPDGSWFAGADVKSAELRVWDAKTGGLQAVVRNPTRISAAQVAPNGAWIATASLDGVRLWDPRTGEPRMTIPHAYGEHPHLTVAPDGTWLLTVTNDEVRVWDAETGVARTSIAHPHTPWTAVIPPDGTWVAIGSASDVRIWGTARGEARAVLPNATRPHVTTADGSRLLTFADDGMRVWDTATWREELHVPLSLHSRWPLIAADGAYFAVGDDDGVRVRDTVTGDVVARFPQSRYCWPLALAPDGSWLAVLHEGDVRIWDTRTGTLRAKVTTPVVSADTSPDGSWLAVHDGQAITIRDTADGGPLNTVPREDESGDFVVSPDGTWLATGGDALRVWDTTLPERPVAPTSAEDHAGPAVGPNEPVTTITAPDSAWFAVNAPGVTALFDTASGRLLSEVRHGLVGGEHFVTADGAWLVVAADGRVTLWNTSTGQSRVPGLTEAGGLRPFVKHSRHVTAKGWRAGALQDHSWRVIVAAARTAGAPDGSWLALDHGNGVLVRDTLTGDTITRLDFTNDPLSFAVAPDGSWLAVDTESGTRIWHTSDWAQRSRTTTTGTLAAVAPDASWLVSVARSTEVHVRAVDGERLATFDVPDVRSVSVSPDGSALLVVGGTGSARVWWRGSGATALMRTDQSLWGGAWSRDGTGVLVVGPRGAASFDVLTGGPGPGPRDTA